MTRAQGSSDGNGKPLEPDTYFIQVSSGAVTIVYVGPDTKGEIVLDASGIAPYASEFEEAYRDARGAKEEGETAAYTKATDYMRLSITTRERIEADASAAAEAFARDHGLRVTNLAGAQKDLKNLEKLKTEYQDKERKADLQRYIGMLQANDGRRKLTDERKQQLAELEARKFGSKQSSAAPLPGACPEGESGGLLAGGINSVFGSDLAGICNEELQRRRDTDRPAGGQRDRHEERD